MWVGGVVWCGVVWCGVVWCGVVCGGASKPSERFSSTAFATKPFTLATRSSDQGLCSARFCLMQLLPPRVPVHMPPRPPRPSCSCSACAVGAWGSTCRRRTPSSCMTRVGSGGVGWGGEGDEAGLQEHSGAGGSAALERVGRRPHGRRKGSKGSEGSEGSEGAGVGARPSWTGRAQQWHS